MFLKRGRILLWLAFIKRLTPTQKVWASNPNIYS